MGVVLILALIWAVVLVPPALRAHAARQEAFLASIGSAPASESARPALPHSVRVQRRRRIAGGLLIAAVATLAAGLLPTFRVLLVVHLFLVDSFIAYIALLAYGADRAARAAAPAVEAAPEPEPEPQAQPVPAKRRRRRRLPAPVLPELAPLG